jgi:hypothetical protein
MNENSEDQRDHGNIDDYKSSELEENECESPGHGVRNVSDGMGKIKIVHPNNQNRVNNPFNCENSPK